MGAQIHLSISINHQNPFAIQCQLPGQVEDSGGLADAAFEVIRNYAPANSEI